MEQRGDGMGDTPATRPGDGEGEGLDRELRHLETEEGRGEERGGNKWRVDINTDISPIICYDQ